jgi:hypothetical protein
VGKVLESAGAAIEGAADALNKAAK